MAFTSNDDLNILQASDSQNVGAGAGNDTYIVTPTTMSAGQTINITDTEGANNIKLVGGVTIVSSTVAANSIQLTINNGGIINIFGADTFSYILGGDAFDATSGVSQSFTDFVTNSLGLSAVPTGTNTANGTTTNESVNEDGTIGTPTPTFALAGAASVDEGATANFTLTTTNVADGTTVDYTIAGVSAADVTGGLTGTVTVTGNTATIAVPVVADTTTEGAETLTVSIDGQAGVSASTTVNDTSTTPTTPTFDLAANAANANEGTTATFTLTTTNVADGTSVAYTVSGVDAADVDSLTGTATVNNNTATISVALTEDNTTEGAETLTVEIDGQTASAVMTVNDTSLDPNNQTFTLTGNTDSVPGLTGSAGSTDSAGDNTFIATEATLTSGDTIVDADGTDTLRYASSGAVAVIESGFAVENVETIRVTSDVTVAGGTTFDMTGVDGATTYVNDNSSANLTTTGIQNLVNLQVEDVNGGNTLIQFIDSVLSGSADSVNLTLDNVQTDTGAAASTLSLGNTSGTTGIETLNITTENGVSNVTDIVTAAPTINVTGDQNLSVVNNLEGATTINASSFTGALSVVVDSGAIDVVVTGGTGDDTADFTNGFDAGDTFDGGDGTADTIGMNMAVATGALGGTITNVEQLNITDAVTGTIDMDNFSGINRVTFDAGLAAGTTTVDDAVTGITVEVDVTNDNTANLTVDLRTDAPADEVTVALDSVDAGDNIGTITVDDAETLNISADDDTADGSGTVGVASLVLTDTTTLNLSGDADLTIATFNNAAATPLVATIDASGMTGVLGNTALGSVGATTGLSTVASGATYTFGSGGTDWTMGAIVGTQTGGDTINLGSGTDIIRYTNANQSSGLTSDTVVGFAQGTDIINLQNVVGGPVNTSSLFLGNAANTTAAETALSGTAGQAVFVQSDNALVVDIDGDGNIGAADLRIVMDGITSMTAADLGLVGGVTFTANTTPFNTATAANSAENNAVGNEADTINATVAQLAGSTVDGLLGADTLNISGTAAANEVANLTGAFTNVETVTLDSTVEGVSMDQDDLTTNAGDTDSETTTITGVSGTTQSLAINNTSDISDVTITNIETLDVTGAATMTLAQHNGFAAITAAAAADSITLDNAGTIAGDADIETYTLANGNNTFTIGAAAQSVTESGGTNSVIGGGLGLAGTFTAFDANDTLTVTTGGSINGANGGADLGFGTLNLTGATTMTEAQHDAFMADSGIVAAGAADIVNIATGNLDSIAVDTDVESYVIADDTGDDGFTVATVTGAQNIDVSASDDAGDVVTVSISGTYTGTITGEGTANDVATLAAGTNISGATLIDVEDLTLNGSATMTDAQYDAFSGTVTAAGAADSITVTDNASALVIDTNVETYTFASTGNDTTDITLANAGIIATAMNIAAGGADVITIDNTSIEAGATSVVTVTGFTTDDQIVSQVNNTSIVTGAYLTADAGNKITGQTAGNVIEIHSTGTNGVAIANPTSDASVLASLNAVLTNGGTTGDIADGDYNVIGYNGNDAYIYQVTVAGNNNGTAGGDDLIELVGTLSNVGADVLTAANFA